MWENNFWWKPTVNCWAATVMILHKVTFWKISPPIIRVHFLKIRIWRVCILSQLYGTYIAHPNLVYSCQKMLIHRRDIVILPDEFLSKRTIVYILNNIYGNHQHNCNFLQTSSCQNAALCPCWTTQWRLSAIIPPGRQNPVNPHHCARIFWLIFTMIIM